MSLNILPDSRLKETKAVVLADWPMPDGTAVRMQMEPIYCVNCGRPNGYVPAGVVSWVSWLCLPCAETWGEHANNWRHPDESFWEAVGAEMIERFGRHLTGDEIEIAADQGMLGRALELLERESPYKV